MDPPPPSAPRLSPISRPTGIATINTAGTAANGDDARGCAVVGAPGIDGGTAAARVRIR